MRGHIERVCNSPKGFKICLLFAAFYHGDVTSRQPGQSAENLLG